MWLCVYVCMSVGTASVVQCNVIAVCVRAQAATHLHIRPGAALQFQAVAVQVCTFVFWEGVGERDWETLCVTVCLWAAVTAGQSVPCPLCHPLPQRAPQRVSPPTHTHMAQDSQQLVCAPPVQAGQREL